MYILGLSAYYHDSAACLLRDGELIAAAQEERFTRVKHDPGFPRRAIEACLRQAGISFDDVHFVGFYEKPHLKFERILQTAANVWPRGRSTLRQALHTWLSGKFQLPEILREELTALSPSQGGQMRWDGRVMFCDHHYSHAASAFFPSPFSEAAILTLDGVGEWASTTMAIGRNDQRGVPCIEFLGEMRYPHSLGMLYSAITSYLGFKVNSGEYKVMGLAPYGTPIYAQRMLERLLDLREDGSFALRMQFFDFTHAHRMVNERFEQLFELPSRAPESLLTQQHFDVAASIQRVAEEVVLRMARHVHQRTSLPRLCLAGGVALNCVANGKLLREGPFADVWIQPAAGDAGGALGAAWYIWHQVLGRHAAPRTAGRDRMRNALLGPEFSAAEIRGALDAAGLPYTELTPEDVPVRVSQLLADQHIVGWFQGRMEFGPRALGSRSILGDSRSSEMQRTMNLKIKFRESFRPFAPIVLRERVADWFELDGKDDSLLGSPSQGYDSPYMLLVARVAREHCHEMTEDQQQLFGIEKLNVVRSRIPSATHVDYSARVQTVAEHDNPLLHRLLECFGELTGVHVLVNTSFNVRGEPIVCSPEDAIRCFLGTEIDALCLGNFLVEKRNIPADKLTAVRGYEKQFSLD